MVVARNVVCLSARHSPNMIEQDTGSEYLALGSASFRYASYEYILDELALVAIPFIRFSVGDIH